MEDEHFALFGHYYFDYSRGGIDLINLRIDIEDRMPPSLQTETYYPKPDIPLLPPHTSDNFYVSHNPASPQHPRHPPSHPTPNPPHQPPTTKSNFTPKPPKNTPTPTDLKSYIPRSKLANFSPTTTHDPKTQNEYIEKINIIKDFFYIKHGLCGQKLWEFFEKDENGKYIGRKGFLDGIQKSGFGELSVIEISDVYSFIDGERSEKMALNGFMYHFFTRIELEQAQSDTFIDVGLEKEFRDLFDGLDEDKSGQLDQVEFMQCLRKLGCHINPEIVQDEFTKVDRDASGLVDFKEFKVLMGNVMQKDLLNVEGILTRVKQQWVAAHPRGNLDLNLDQYVRAMGNCGFKLDREELLAIFEELSHQVTQRNYVAPGSNLEIENSSNGVRMVPKVLLDDFIRLLTADGENKAFMNPKVRTGVLNIKRSSNLSIGDLFLAYSEVPENYCNSFTS
jgi:Ca2+-binding EF-hand superfamily protein